MAALTAALDDEAQEVEDYSAEFDSVSSFASSRAAARRGGGGGRGLLDRLVRPFAGRRGPPKWRQPSEDFESPARRRRGGLGGPDESAAEFDNAATTTRSRRGGR